MVDSCDAENACLFSREMTNILHTRQLFVTKAGRFGYTKRGVQPGDVVVVFSSAPVPHVLRRVRQEGDSVERWRFVGDAYVHDLMDFEADEMDAEVAELVVI